MGNCEDLFTGAFLEEHIQGKTKVVHISEGVDFLGQDVRKYHFDTAGAKLIIKPSNINIKTLLTSGICGISNLYFYLDACVLPIAIARAIFRHRSY